MCSIFGYNYHDSITLSIFFDSMKHRGPDDDGSTKIHNWTIGQQRLAIIDTSAKANQPMRKREHYLAFNGEIYNYLELKDKYLKGVRFKTQSDTEVLLELLSKYGLKILNKLNGMFAFAWYNAKTKKLVLARDRFGVKPLYYMHNKDKFYFASETKPLARLQNSPSLNQTAISIFLKHTASDYLPQSFLNDINLLLPGHYLTIHNNSVGKQMRWYHGNDFVVPRHVLKTKIAAFEYFEQLLTDAIKLRYRSDVPVCLSLSGGIDSTTIYTLTKEHISQAIQPITFSNTNSGINEVGIAKRLTTDYRDKLIIVKSKPHYSTRDLRRALSALEFPIWNPSALAYLDLYQKIHKLKYVVIIEGHGSDEQLGGYPFQLELIWKNLAQNFQFISAYHAYHAYKLALNSNIGEKLNPYPFIIQLIKVILEIPFKRYNAQAALDQSFHQNILPIVLRAFDRLPMNQSLESRSPYLDYRVVEFIKSLPLHYKVDKYGSKAPLRYILRKYHKQYIYENVPKTGFALDLVKLFKQPDMKKLFSKYLHRFNNPKFDIEKEKLLSIFTQKNYLWSDVVYVWKYASIELTKELYEKH